MKKKIVAAFCLAMVMTVGGCSGAGTAAQPESSESQTQPASVSESSSSSDASEENSTQKSASSTASSDAADASSSRDIFAMDTYMTVTAYGPIAETAVDQAQQEIERLDALLSTGEKTSEVAQINANGGGTLSEDTTYLLERSLDLYDSTNGVFDIAIYPIMDAWGFTTGNYTIPSDDTIESLLRRNRKGLYIRQNCGYLPGMRCDERAHQPRWKRSGCRHENGWQQMACCRAESGSGG